MVKEKIRALANSLIKKIYKKEFSHPIEVWQEQVIDSTYLSKEIYNDETLTIGAPEMRPYDRYLNDVERLKKTQSFKEQDLKGLLALIESDFEKEVEDLVILEKKALRFLIDNGNNPFLTPDSKSNPFGKFGMESALVKLKGTLFGFGKNNNQDFFKQQAAEYFDNSALIFKHLNVNGKTKTLNDFVGCTDIKSHIVQAIPPQNAKLSTSKQTPDKELLLLNELTDYKKYWIAPGSEDIGPFNSVDKILSLLSVYGYYIELDKKAVFDPSNPDTLQVSKNLKKHIVGYSQHYNRKLDSYKNYSTAINMSRSRLYQMLDRNDFVIERFLDLLYSGPQKSKVYKSDVDYEKEMSIMFGVKKNKI